MNELNESDYHSLFKSEENVPFNKKTDKKQGALNLFVVIALTILIIITWFSVYMCYLSYENSSKKSGDISRGLSLNLKTDTLRYNKIKTNLAFFKTVNKDQINISNLFYLLSLHRFGSTYVSFIKTDNGRIIVGIVSLNKQFLKSLRLVRDYAMYLNISDSQMHTNGFKITALAYAKAKKGKHILGVLTSNRYKPSQT